MALIPNLGIELARWRDQLRELRQPWPEWERLEQVVARESFTLESDDDVPFQTRFLAGPRDNRGYRLIHNVLTPNQEQQFKQAIQSKAMFPAYLVAILGLKFSDSLMMAGGIGDYVCPWEVEASLTIPDPVGVETCNTMPHNFGNLNATDIRWPINPVYPFQSNSFGGMFCINDDNEITSFSARQRTFSSIGSSLSFIRFCMDAALDARDWYNTYMKGLGLQEFGLRFIDDVGMD